MGVGTAVGVAPGVAAEDGVLVAPALAEGDAPEAVADADAEAAALGDGLGEGDIIFTGLESKITPQTVQVLCCLPIAEVVGSSTVVQSAAICPRAEIVWV